MTALAKNTHRPGKAGEENQYGVAALTTIYKGAASALDDDGYLVPMDETRGRRFVGIATEGADNSAGDDDDLKVRVVNDGWHRFAHATATVDDIGKACFFDDDNTVVFTSKPVFAGIMADLHEDSGYIWVNIEPATKVQGQMHGTKLVTCRINQELTVDNTTRTYGMLTVPEGFNARLLECRVTNLVAYALAAAGTLKIDLSSKVGAAGAVPMITQVDAQTSCAAAVPFRATLHATDGNLVAAEKAQIYATLTVANDGGATQAEGLVVEADFVLFPIGA